MLVHLTDTEATLALGRAMAAAFADAPCRAIMLEGGLGAGKTTLVRSLVEALPGGDDAEVSSPSFNLYNLYPTSPETAHFDLYRLEGMPLGESGESLAEMFHEGRHLVIVEWCQFLPRELWPPSYLHIRWQPAESGRDIEIAAVGEDAQAFRQAFTARAGNSLLVKES